MPFQDDGISAYPLMWPSGWKRTSYRDRARFGETSVGAETKEILRELALLKVYDRTVVISTNVKLRQDGLPLSNQRIPGDPGVAVYFKLKDARRVLACDKWDRVEHNMRAIAKHIDALRGQERWGVGSVEQAFAGYTALPEMSTARNTLGLNGAPLTRAQILAAYRAKSLEAHPDQGGSDDAFIEITKARDELLEEIGEEP